MADKLRYFTVGERLGQNRKSEYLGAEDINDGAEPILTIQSAWDGTITTAKGKEFAEGILFKEKTVPGILNVRPLIVNATNRKTLKKLFGSTKQEDIADKKIQLYVDHAVRDPTNGGKCDGIRIRPFVPKVEAPIACENCKMPIQAAYGMSASEFAEYSKAKKGKKLCAKCATAETEKPKEPEADPNTGEVIDETDG